MEDLWKVEYFFFVII